MWRATGRGGMALGGGEILRAFKQRQVTVWECRRTCGAVAMLRILAAQSSSLPFSPGGVRISKSSDKVVYSFIQQIFIEH